MKRNTCIILAALMFLALHKEAFMQESVKLVTRKTEKTFTFNSKYGQLIIEAEKGNISIQNWDRDEVSVVLSISAKNSNTELANHDLDYVHYNLVKDRGNIFVNNKVVLPDADREISGVLTARYDIKVPKGTNIRVNNKFGRVTLAGTSVKVISGNLQYCDMLLKDFKGLVDLTISVGDLQCMQSEMEGSVKLRHADVVIDGTKGNLSLQSRYGSLNLKYGDSSINVTATSYATDILIDNRACHPLDINLKGTYCPLTLTRECFAPDKKLLQTDYKPEDDQSGWTLLYTPTAKTTKLKITAEFGKMNLL